MQKMPSFYPPVPDIYKEQTCPSLQHYKLTHSCIGLSDCCFYAKASTPCILRARLLLHFTIMKLSIVPSFCIFAFPAVTYAVSLIDALNSNGASTFAQQIQSNPDILALYTSSSVQTVYAVHDSSTGNGTLRRRQSNPQQLDLHCSAQLTNLESMSVFPGTVSNTQLVSPQLQQHQAVVSQSGVSTNTSASHRRRSAGGTVPLKPVSLASGLGAQVNVLSGDIPYDGGLIHIVDG